MGNEKISFLAVIVLMFIAEATAINNIGADVALQDFFPKEFRMNSGEDIGLSGNFNVLVKKELNLTLGSNESRGELFRVYLSNGRYASVKIFPENASLIAIAKMNASCSERNCTLILKETGSGSDARAVYEVKAEKKVRILGLINSRMNVSADVDAETGDVLAVHRPWWAFVAFG